MQPHRETTASNRHQRARGGYLGIEKRIVTEELERADAFVELAIVVAEARLEELAINVLEHDEETHGLVVDRERSVRSTLHRNVLFRARRLVWLAMVVTVTAAATVTVTVTVTVRVICTIEYICEIHHFSRATVGSNDMPLSCNFFS